MTIWTILLIIGILGIAIFWYVNYQLDWDNLACAIIFIIFIILGLIGLVVAPLQAWDNRTTNIRMLKERQQILYQIENIKPDTDKIKLNKWILTYNDWINDILAEKETFGWFAWHNAINMNNHEYINLV